MGEKKLLPCFHQLRALFPLLGFCCCSLVLLLAVRCRLLLFRCGSIAAYLSRAAPPSVADDGPSDVVTPRSGGYPLYSLFVTCCVQKIVHSRSICKVGVSGERGGGQIAPRKCTPKCTPYVKSRSPIFKFKSSLKTSAIAFHAVVFGVHEAPCTTGRSSKGQLQQQRVT